MVTNKELALMLKHVVDRFDARDKTDEERHNENKETLREIKLEVKTTNGRVTTAEKSIAVQWFALGLIGAVSLAAFGVIFSKLFL